MYLYGQEFEPITDHKALDNPLLRLQAYQYKVKYKPGKANISEWLSSLILERTKSSKISDFNEKHLNSVAKTVIPVAMTAAETEAKSEKDQKITNIRVCILSND